MRPEIMLIVICVSAFIISALLITIVILNKRPNRTYNSSMYPPPPPPPYMPNVTVPQLTQNVVSPELSTSTTQVTLQQLQSMTPTQINGLKISSLNDLIKQYYSNFQGIPQFPGLQTQLSTAQYNAFYTLYTGGKVY